MPKSHKNEAPKASGRWIPTRPCCLPSVRRLSSMLTDRRSALGALVKRRVFPTQASVPAAIARYATHLSIHFKELRNASKCFTAFENGASSRAPVLRIAPARALAGKTRHTDCAATANQPGRQGLRTEPCSAWKRVLRSPIFPRAGRFFCCKSRGFLSFRGSSPCLCALPVIDGDLRTEYPVVFAFRCKNGYPCASHGVRCLGARLRRPTPM